MSEGTEYPKFITLDDGLKVVVTSAADEAVWRNAPTPPSPIDPPIMAATVEEPVGTVGSFIKKLKTKVGASHA